jgi:hypothetical protein
MAYTSLPGPGAEIASAYRELEVAYHELQVAQVHLRSVHARTMHERVRDHDLLRQELARLSDRMDEAMSSYREAMSRYEAATATRFSENEAPPLPSSHRSGSFSTPRFRAESSS